MKNTIKIKLLALLTTAAILLTGCQIMDFSLLTGKGALSTSDIVFPKETEKGENTETDVNDTEEIINPENPTELPDNPIEPFPDPNVPDINTEPDEPVKQENKKGLIAHKMYLFQGTTNNTAKNKTIINTTEEYQSFLNTVTDYANKNNLNSSLLKEYFFVVLTTEKTNIVCEYSIDSVKNDDRLNITVLQGKTTVENEKNTVILVAISRKDIPNMPSINQINAQTISFTINSSSS